MGDSLGTVIVIAIAAILMFVFPVMTMADRTDDVSQLTVQTETTEFVDEIRTTGKITPEKYDQFVQSITSTGNLYDVDIEVKVLDENPLDWQLLGIGGNGHIGFNEPGASFEGTTQRVKLTEATLEANARFFDSIDEVPTEAYSMGIGSILKSKKIVLLAFGEEKAAAIKAMIEGPVTNEVPATALQSHDNVMVFLDEAAASLLSK